jgi:hypothetical protein
MLGAPATNGHAERNDGERDEALRTGAWGCPVISGARSTPVLAAYSPN